MRIETFVFTVIVAMEAVILVWLSQIKESIEMSQEKFDKDVAAINAKLDGIGATLQSNAETLNRASQDLAAERQQISDFIAAHPETDTSALSGVLSRLSGIGSTVDGQAASLSNIDTGIGDIFTPPAAAVDQADGGGADQSTGDGAGSGGDAGSGSSTDPGTVPVEQAPPQTDDAPPVPEPAAPAAPETEAPAEPASPSSPEGGGSEG